MSRPPQLRVLRDASSLCEAARTELLRQAEAAISARGAFTLALAGGSTPRGLYEALAARPVDFSRWTLCFGDERCVPPDHAESNYRMVREAWLEATPHPPPRVLRMRGEDPPARAAERYEGELHEVLGTPPRLDLALLGLGADGHTASLFPGSPALAVQDRLVVATEGPAPLGRRISLTVPALRQARGLLFLVQGQHKATALVDVIAPPPGASSLPARLVAADHPHALWLVDTAAAAELQGR